MTDGHIYRITDKCYGTQPFITKITEAYTNLVDTIHKPPLLSFSGILFCTKLSFLFVLHTYHNFLTNVRQRVQIIILFIHFFIYLLTICIASTELNKLGNTSVTLHCGVFGSELSFSHVPIEPFWLMIFCSETRDEYYRFCNGKATVSSSCIVVLHMSLSTI